MLPARALLALVLVTSPLSAGVIVVDAVGGGDFTMLSAAVAAAVSGDTILVREGEYVEAAPIVIDGKTLTVTGEHPGPFLTARIQPGLIVQGLQPGQRVVLVNLFIQGSSGTPTLVPRSALTLVSNGSHVRVERCELYGGSGTSNLHPAGAPAVTVSDSFSNAIVGCWLRGGDGQFSPNLGVICGDGGAGLAFDGGLVALSACDLEGGDGGSNHVGAYPQGGTGGDGMRHQAGTLFVVGGFSRGGEGGIAHWGGDGGDGIDMGAGGYAWLMGAADAWYGSLGVGDNESGEDGVPINDPFGVVTDWSETVHGLDPHGFDANSPVREGWGGALILQGHFTDSTLLFASLSPHLFPLPGRQGVFMISSSGMIGPIAFGPPGNGSVLFSTPALPAALEVLHVFLQPVYVGSDGTFLGTGRVFTIFDSSF